MKALFIAPHYSDEPNGANIYCEWVKNSILTSFNIVDFVDAKGLVRAENGQVCRIKSVDLKSQSKVMAVFKSVFLFRSYYSERLAPDGLDMLDLDVDGYDLIIVSFAYVYFKLSKGILKKCKTPVLILTHNYDLDVFDGWNKQSLIKKILVGFYKYVYVKEMKQLQQNIVLGNISENDSRKYEQKFPQLKSIYIPPTIHSPFCVRNKISDKINICFLGSLSTPFNEEALMFYAQNINVVLSENNDYSFHVFGSSPTNKVRELVKKHDWILHENLDSSALDIELSKMTFGTLPFQYTQGVKLKLYHYFSVGLPILATGIFEDELSSYGNLVLCSDKFEEWNEKIISLSVNDHRCLTQRGHSLSQELNVELSNKINNIIYMLVKT